VQRTVAILKDNQEYEDIIKCMEYDQKIELVEDDTYKAVDYNFPRGLVDLGDKMNGRLVFSEIPCAHCSLAKHCRPNGVINPHRCVYFD